MFAGIGGFRAGLDRAGGFQCVGHCEIDKYADASYRAIHNFERRSDTIQTPEKLTQATCPTLNCSAADFLASLGQRQEIDLASLTQEELSSLRLPAWLKQESLRICCLKMFPEFYSMTKDGHLRSSLPRFMSWGMVSNGVCLTAQIIPHSQGEGYSLSDILIPDVPEKYFLSPEQTERLLYKSSAGRRDQESMIPEE